MKTTKLYLACLLIVSLPVSVTCQTNSESAATEKQQQPQKGQMGRMGMEQDHMGRGMGRGKMGMMQNMPMFKDIDVNQDGSISSKELATFHKQRKETRMQQQRMMKNMKMAPPFEEIDSNKDGLISKGEFAAHQNSMMKMRNSKKQ